MWKPFVDLGSYRSELANANFILECILNPLHTLKILRLALNSSDERSGRNVIQSQPKLEVWCYCSHCCSLWENRTCPCLPCGSHRCTPRANSLHHTLMPGLPTRPASLKHEWECSAPFPSRNRNPSCGSWFCRGTIYCWFLLLSRDRHDSDAFNSRMKKTPRAKSPVSQLSVT